MTPTDFAPREIAQQAHRLAPVLGDLVGDVAEAGVAHGAARPARDCAPARRSPSAAAVTSSSTRCLRPVVERALRGARPRDERGDDRVRCGACGHSRLIARSFGRDLRRRESRTPTSASSSLISASNSAGVDRRRLGALREQLLLDLAAFSSTFDDRRVELRDHGGRRLRRRERAVPRVDDVVGHALLGDRRHVRRRDAALGARHGDRLAACPAFTCCHAAGIDTNSSCTWPPMRVGHRRTAALVRDVHDVDAGLELEQLAGDVARRADADRRVVELAGIAPWRSAISSCTLFDRHATDARRGSAGSSPRG